MNVYVRSLASALARAGVAVDVLTRAEQPTQPAVVTVEPGFRVVHVEAGPCRPVPLRDLPDLVAPFVDRAETCLAELGGDHSVLHANYWVSGAVAHALKHRLHLPLVSTFHTLERVKDELGVGADSSLRPRVEAEVVRCADLVVASTHEEVGQLVRHYGADADRVAVIPPGVDHDVFGPGDRAAARLRVLASLGIHDDRRAKGPLLLFVGRIQHLKGVDLAVRSFAALGDPDATLLVVGGPSGPDGVDEVRSLHKLAAELGVADRVRFVPPQLHERLADFYRAADICVVPSRSESFGLVALEAAACGTPVVAAAVGGLRTLVEHERTGLLVDDREPQDYAAAIRRLLDGEGAAMGAAATRRASEFRWSTAAARLRRLYDDLAARALVRCR